MEIEQEKKQTLQEKTQKIYSIIKNTKTHLKTWTLLVVVKDQSSHLVYLNICIK